MIKILHTADIHLDSPFTLSDVQKAHIRKNELRGTFTSLMMYAKMEKFDLVIISGDLFDTGYATKETMELIAAQFADNPGCRFVIAPGNHDPLTPRSPYRKIKFPNNVYIFADDDITKFSFDDIGVDVYGWAFTDSKKPENPLRNGKLVLSSEKINILAAHADLVSGASDCCPINESDIAASGFDYVALGHIHAGGEIKKIGKTFFAYSGCLEGRSFDECGSKGVIICKIDSAPDKMGLSFSQKRFSSRRYEKEEIDVTGAVATEEIVGKIRSLITERKWGSDTLLRIKLKGMVSPEFVINKSLLTEKTLGLFYFELIDATIPLLDTNLLMNDITIRGAFFRELLPKLKSEDEEERRIAAEALRYGMAALSGDDVIDF